MPPNTPFLTPPNQQVLTEIRDKYGELILTAGVREYAVPENGMMVFRKTADSFATVDDFQWSPLMAMRQHDPIFLAVCEFCRHPKLRLFRREVSTHGLCTMRNALACVDCGATTCPRHRRIDAFGNPRCRRCSFWNRLWCLVRPVFFRRVKE